MNPKILIIDDDQMNLNIMKKYLTNKNYEIITAIDGSSGIQTAVDTHPDLILLDVLMPGRDGFETCRKIKELEQLKNIPIIFLTALADSASIIKAFKEGAVDYITKPIELLELAARVEIHIRLKMINGNLKLEVAKKTKKLQIANKKLEKLLHEKEFLLKELYHRTKNNMQVISSFLSLKSNYIDKPEISEILLETENMVRSMALVHQKLYQSSDLSRIDLKEYIIDLVWLIQSSYANLKDHIVFRLDLDAIHVLIDTAISCGVILNELISNAFKHAFPDNAEGIIHIALKKTDTTGILLCFRDNGIGVPDNYDITNCNTLGMKTVIGIGEDQLNGEIKIKLENGFSFELEFQNILNRS